MALCLKKKSFFDNFAIFLSKNGQNLPKNENLENLEHAFVENNFSIGLYAGGAYTRIKIAVFVGWAYTQGGLIRGGDYTWVFTVPSTTDLKD